MDGASPLLAVRWLCGYGGTAASMDVDKQPLAGALLVVSEGLGAGLPTQAAARRDYLVSNAMPVESMIALLVAAVATFIVVRLLRGR